MYLLLSIGRFGIYVKFLGCIFYLQLQQPFAIGIHCSTSHHFTTETDPAMNEMSFSMTNNWALYLMIDVQSLRALRHRVDFLYKFDFHCCSATWELLHVEFNSAETGCEPQKNGLDQQYQHLQSTCRPDPTWVQALKKGPTYDRIGYSSFWMFEIPT